jgi:dihydrofolate synthase / folylpolyglutamate synthase
MSLRGADEILASLEPLGMRLGLAPFRDLLLNLGSPEREVPAVLVAGTNGKGSTAAMIAAIACAAGYRTGLYTSPHLEESRERIRIDGLALATLELDRLLELVMNAAGETLPTPFEALTAAAFVAFAEGGVDLAVLEVGLGGRLDATNACEPLLSVVTPIALDHQEVLGSTLAAIAVEKAGVLRPGRPAIVDGADGEATAALSAAAADRGADLVLADRAAKLEGWEVEGLAGQRGTVRTTKHRHALRLPLAGAHQRRNAALAVLAAERLSTLGFARIDGKAVSRGIAGCRWPGRLELVALPTGAHVLLDGAHNAAGAEALAAQLATLDAPWDLVFGTLADKDATSMAELLASRARKVVLAPPATPRALPLAALSAIPAVEGAVAAHGVGEALELALAAVAPLLVVAGSLYVVGEARSWLRARFGVPPAAADLSTWEPPQEQALRL